MTDRGKNMFKFIKIKQIVLFLASLLTSVGFLSATVVVAQTTETTPGNVCQPANLRQALNRGMSWNQFRVFNPSDTREFFVTCGIQRTQDVASANDRGAVIAHFDVGYDSADDISCIWRTVSEQVTADNIASTVIAQTETINGGGLILPDTRFNNAYDFSDSSTDTNDFWTVTCLLPPKTGINNFVTF